MVPLIHKRKIIMPQIPYDRTESTLCYAYQVDLKTGAETVGKIYEGLSPIHRTACVIASTPTPNFRYVKKFYLPMNNYTKITVEMSDQLDYYIDYKDPFNYYRGVWHRTIVKEGISVVDEILSPDLEAGLTTKLLGILSQQKALTLVSLAEINKTADMISKTATSLAGFLTGIRKGRLKSALASLGVKYEKVPRSEISRFSRQYRKINPKRHKGMRSQELDKFVSKQWLAYSYGWKPLLFDIHQQAAALAQQTTDHNDVVRVALVRDAVELMKRSRGTYGGTVKADILRVEKLLKRQQLKVFYRIPNGGVPSFVAFGVLNPLEVAWELIPYSFVVDWFIPIGDYLRSLIATVGLNFHSGTNTVTESRSYNLLATDGAGSFYTSAPGYTQKLSLGGSYVRKTFTMNRTVFPTFPYPSVPGFKDPRSLTHAASAIALLLTVVNRRSS